MEKPTPGFKPSALVSDLFLFGVFCIPTGARFFAIRNTLLPLCHKSVFLFCSFCVPAGARLFKNRNNKEAIKGRYSVQRIIADLRRVGWPMRNMSNRPQNAPQRRNQGLIILRVGWLWIYNTISVSIGQIMELPDGDNTAKATGNGGRRRWMRS